jgi:hypothetical protein
MQFSLYKLHRSLTLIRLIFLFIFLLLFIFTSLFDADYFWHLKTGEFILTHQHIPPGDIFSYTLPGKEWVLHEWLFEVILSTLHKVGSSILVNLFVSISGTLIFILLYKISSIFIQKPYLALFTSTLFWPIIGMGLSPRPQILSYLFFSIYVYLIVRFKKNPQYSPFYLLPLLMVFWVNLHGGFVIGLGFLLLCILSEYKSISYRGKISRYYEQGFKKLQFFTLLTFAASLCNPYFIKQWLFPFYLVSLKTGQLFISEWQSPNFHVPGFFYYLCVIFLVFFLIILRPKKPSVFEILLAFSFIIASFFSARHIPLAAIAFLPVTSSTVSDFINSKNVFHIKITTATKFFRKYTHNSKELGLYEFTLNWILLFLIIFSLSIYYPFKKYNDVQAMNDKLPVKAVDFIIQNQIKGNVFNAYDYGGYLISRFYPERLVFIDGRLDMYGDDFMSDYIEISEGKPKWEELFNKFKIDYVIIQRELPLRQLLIQRGDFEVAFEDKKTVVLIKSKR